MKRAAIVIVLLGLVSGLVFGGGDGEAPPPGAGLANLGDLHGSVVAYSTDTLEVMLSLGSNLGFEEVRFASLGGQWTHGYSAELDAGGTVVPGTLRNIFTGEALASIAQIPEDARPSGLSFEDARTPVPVAGRPLAVAIADTQIDVVSDISVLGTARRRDRRAATIPVTYRNEESRYIGVLIDENGAASRLRAVLLTYAAEFFAGEKELFDQNPQYEYHENAVAFLNTFFDDNSFEQVMSEAGYSQAVLNLYDAQSAQDDWAVHQRRFADAFVRQFPAPQREYLYRTGNSGSPIGSAPVSVLGLDQGATASIYSSNRNPYVAAYLTYLFARTEVSGAEQSVPIPVLQSLIKLDLEDIDRDSDYAYSDYRLVSADEGLSIANAALRYLSWGVEFTLRTEDGGYPAMRMVFHDAIGDPMLRGWIAGEDGDGDHRDQNYYGGEVFEGLDAEIPFNGNPDTYPELANNQYFTFTRLGIINAGGSALHDRMSSPFVTENTEPGHEGEFVGTFGNPLPVVPAGVDTPRSFNYKMFEQVRAATAYAYTRSTEAEARESLPVYEIGPSIHEFSSLAVRETGGEAYSNYREPETRDAGILIPTWASLEQQFGEADVPLPDGLAGDAVQDLLEASAIGIVAKPFVPGAIHEVIPQDLDWQIADGFVSAGVSGYGLLLGSLSMALDDVNRFRAADGVALVHNMSAYSQMTDSSQTTLDNAELPAFPAADARAAAGIELALQMADLEVASVLIPDISFLQPGDLLVRYVDEDEETLPEVAIVVGLGWDHTGQTPGYGAEITEWWDQVYVVSATEALGVVTLATWGAGDTGLLTQFSDGAYDYHLRRLVVERETGSFDDVENAAWYLTDMLPASLGVEIDWIDDRYETAHAGEAEGNYDLRWIPNTQAAEGDPALEALVAEQITVRRLNAAGGVIPNYDPAARESFTPLVVLSPEDLYATNPEADDHEQQNSGSNVYRNKGAGFELLAANAVGNGPNGVDTDWRVVATITLDETPSDPRYPYEVEMESGTLGMTGLGRLEYHEAGRSPMDTFGIRAIADGAFRPGDDLLLRFGLASHPSINGAAEQEDFIATYDKRMLWRANLYVDEGEGDLDWNNAHRWNHPDNEWNLTNGGVPADGGQVAEILPWTRWVDGETVTDSVAYGWGGCDGVSVFNDKLNVQQDLLAGLFNVVGVLIADLGDGDSLYPWNQTIAPDGNWWNYQMPTYVDAEGSYTPEGGTEPISYTYWDVTGPVAGTLYVPGWTTYNRWNTDYSDDDPDNPFGRNYHPDHVHYSAGLDCSGLVQTAASYRLPDSDPYEVSLGEANSTRTIAGNANSWLIEPATGDPELDFAGLERLVPGDIIIRSEHHVMIVIQVAYPEDGSSVQPEHVTVVHSRAGAGPFTWQVATGESWGSRLGYFEYSARRLR